MKYAFPSLVFWEEVSGRKITSVAERTLTREMLEDIMFHSFAKNQRPFPGPLKMIPCQMRDIGTTNISFCVSSQLPSQLS